MKSHLGHIQVVLLCMLFLTQIPAYALKQESLPAPYNEVELLPFDGHKWFRDSNAQGLTDLFKTYKVKTVVEIGSYLGGSTRFIAKTLPKDGKVYAVDHWLGNEEFSSMPKVWEKRAIYYEQFLSNVIHEGLCDKIIPMRMSSVEAAKVLDVVPDLVYIDGAHDYESVYTDISTWFAFTEGKGILCGDDYNWGKDRPVKRAVDRFAKEHRLEVVVLGNWFWYYKKQA